MEADAGWNGAIATALTGRRSGSGCGGGPCGAASHAAMAESLEAPSFGEWESLREYWMTGREIEI